MRHLLLFALIAVPAVIWAQPMLTFNPADGATNVSTTGNLTITSNEALNTTAGVNLDDDNVDALVTLLSGGVPVPFDATVNGPQEVITVNPTDPLEDLTTYTLTLQPVENNDGEATSVQSVTFTTGNFNNPEFVISRAVNNIGSAFSFQVEVNEAATVYYVVDQSAGPISEANIRAGRIDATNAAEVSGSFAVSGGVQVFESISGLDFTPPVKFHIHFLAEDAVGDVTTVTIRGIPLLNSSSVPPASLLSNGFDLRVNVDESVTTYYVVTTSNVAPSAAQILAGTDENGAAPAADGSFVVGTANADTDHTITGLDDLITYYVHFVSADGAGNQTVIQTHTATTLDGTPPVIQTRTPPDGTTAPVDISTSTFTLTFDEDVTTINDPALTDAHRIRLFEEGVLVETIARDDVTVGASGAVIADGTSPTATITFVYNFKPNTNYYILVGEEVFEDAAGNNFAGQLATGDWNFITGGVSVNNATSNICSGSFQSISNIVISETGVADFNTGAAQTLVLALEDNAEFVISNSGVSVSSTGADISGLSVSVALTSLTVTYSISGGTALDAITISGLKVYATGVTANTTIIRSGGTADQDGNNGTGASSLTHSTINVGSSPPGQPQLQASQDLIHCENEDITAKTLTLVDQGATVTYNWYSDESLSTLVFSSTNETANIASDLLLTSPAVVGAYSFYVVSVAACQSAPPVEVTVEVTGNPVADAGSDRTGVGAACNGEEITLGGNPTLAVPSAPGSYTYIWEYVESTPEPAAVANPTFTVNNTSTTTPALYNFQVTITDANGCAGTDNVTIEVKPVFDISLVSPNSYTFTPNSPNQNLQASPPDGVFSGVGVVQSNAPSTYQFSPSIAHATDPNTLPKNFNIYYTVTQNGCTVTNHHIATFTIANSFFTSLQPEYCGNEYPNASTSSVLLSLDGTGYTYVDNRKNNWNNSERFSRGPYNNPWQSGLIYSHGTYVRYNNEIYQCNNILVGCSGFTAPDAGGQWVYQNILKVNFNGYIGNYYEDYYGGNAGTSTIAKTTSMYSVGGNSYPYHRFGTNVNYNNCPSCSYAWPAAYLEFERPEDIQQILPQWYPTYYYYRGDLVYYGGNVYQCIASPYTTGTQPDLYPGLWTNVTNADYGNGQYFHKWDASIGAFRSGFYVNGQYVQINRNPTAFFSGLVDSQDVCEFEVLDLENPSSSAGISYGLTGNFTGQSYSQAFAVKLDGSGTYNDGGGSIINDILNPGRATFDTRNAFTNSPGGGLDVKNVEIKYEVNPGTTGSAGQPCYGSSSIVVQVIQNSTFDFNNDVVDADGSVYCYTEPAKGLRSVFNGVAISGAAGTAGSATYSGYGVNNLGNSIGTFRPGVALDQLNPGTTVQQSVPVTATFRDANHCLSTRVRTFKVNPDIQPSFTFGGRSSYCYEDIPVAFTGHTQNYTANSMTITSSGRYDYFFRDPGGMAHPLGTVNLDNTTFTARTFYDQIQAVLTAGNYTADLNQTANLNVVYSETLNAGKVCSEIFSQTMVIAPPSVLDIFGLTEGDILCRNDNSNISQGNLVTFEGSETGSGIFRLDDDADFTAVNATLNSTVNISAGKATINLLSAYNAASDPNNPRQVFLQYEYTAPSCTGPADVVKGFRISPPPALAFDFSAGNTPVNGEVFCNDEPPVQLTTAQNTNVTITGFGTTDSGTGSGEATFNPQLAFNTSVSNGGGSVNSPQNIVITAAISDAIGCANYATVGYIVNPIPQGSVDIDPNELYYCYEDSPRLISGDQTKSWFRIEYVDVTTPFTDFIGDINNNASQFTFDPGARFDHATNSFGASALSPVDFNVYYSVADNNDCINTFGPYTLSVANQIEVSIAGLDDNQIYCSNEDNGVKTLTFNPFPADPSKRTFTINGQNTPLASDKYSFTPGLPGGDFELRYVVVSGNNCSNTEVKTVKALASPEAVFTVSPACENDVIDYNADASANLASATYTWSFSGDIKTGQTVQHQFPGVSTYYAKLKVEHPAYAVSTTQSLVCSDSLQLDQIVGPYPENIDFSFSNVCENDQTSFEVSSDVPINRVSWNFGDGEVTNFGILSENVPTATYPRTTGTYQEPVHQYDGANAFSVTVYGKTSDNFGGCESSKVRVISILEKWAPTPEQPIYDMSAVNGGNGGWVVEDKEGNSTWEFNVARKNWINTDEMAWVTGADEPYRSNDDSYVNSPCFDLTAFIRPVISIKHWADTESSDGAVLQYSLDGGAEWIRLGEVASGLDWYNRLTIASNPGDQPNLTSGWSLSNQESWAVGKHTLDDLPTGQRQQVRFRVAFASFNNTGSKDGFAFNNVVIEERNRTILVENFTSLEQQSNNDAYREFPFGQGDSFNPAELVKLQYHHAIVRSDQSEPDTLHKMNPIDQNARAAFYGVTNPVRAFIDGGFGQSSTNATFESPSIENYFRLRSLVTSPVNLSIEFEPEPSDKLNVKATVQATNNVGSAGEYNVFIAIAEKAVFGQAYVLRKLLPDASGTPLTSLSATDPAQEILVSYDMRHVTRLSTGEFTDFAVIVFVQHLQTKDVLQSFLRQDASPSAEIVTGVETPFNEYLRMYPNPADATLNLILPSPVNKETPIRLFDSFGKQVFTGTFRVGNDTKTITTKEYAAGVYLVEVSTAEGLIRKKVMIVHH